MTCRSCGCADLREVLSLGSTPLANTLLTEAELAEPEETFPLVLVFCPGCALVQITETVPPEKLFRQYFYFSSFSDTMLRHARDIAERLIAERGLGPQSLVVEIASNDGYLLQNYVRAGVPVLGVEPAVNIAEVANEKGVRTIAEFFGEEMARGLEPADVIHANNVLAHVPDLNGVVAGFRYVLKADGVAVIEAPYVGDLIEHCEFDTIYHEHLCYFSLTALDRLFRSQGLFIEHVERIPIHGGSLRIFAGKQDRDLKGAVARLLEEERLAGMDRMEYYQRFADRVRRLKAGLVGMLGQLKAEGRTIAAYGAAAKGSTLLNYCGVGRDSLDFVVDRSHHKQGHYMPGVHLPIYATEKLLEAQPDYTLVLAWNFAPEIMEQQAEYRRRGGKFILPVPEARIV
jgi:SAM-dependent methyltransferase